MPRTPTASEKGRARARAALLSLCALLACAPGARAQSRAGARVPAGTLLQIVQAEDERRWEDSDLAKLLTDANPAVRARAALAAGRIGDEGAVGPLGVLLNSD